MGEVYRVRDARLDRTVADSRDIDGWLRETARSSYKLLAVTPLEQTTLNGFYVVVNWPSLLKRE